MAATGKEKTEQVSLEDWEKFAKSQQEVFLQHFGDRIWDEFEYPGNKAELFMKIGIALYGKALAQADDLGFPEDKKEVINNLLDKCVKHSVTKGKVRLAFIYIAVYVNDTVQNWVPLIRVMSKELPNLKQYYDCFIQQNVYIDHLGRVYENFTSYLDNNTWDLCYICYPASGYYGSGQTFIVRSQIDVKREILDGADKISTITNVVTTCTLVGGLLMCLFPPTAPIGLATATYSGVAAAPGVVYGVGRSVGKLVDRAVHEQSVSLMDPEARQHWLMTATAIASAGALVSSAVITQLAKSGVAASSTARGVCTSLKVASVTLSGASIANQSVDMVSRGKPPTALEIFQITTSLFFFTHSLVEFKTAQALYEENRPNFLTTIKQQLEKFDSMVKKIDKNLSETSAEFIRKIVIIDDISPNISLGGLQITKEVYVMMKKFSFETNKFLKLSESEVKIILDSLQDGKIPSVVKNIADKFILSIQESPDRIFKNYFLNCIENFNTYLSTTESFIKSEKKQYSLKLGKEFNQAMEILTIHIVVSVKEKFMNVEQCSLEEFEKFLSEGSFDEYCETLFDLFISCIKNRISLPPECLRVIMDEVRAESIRSIKWTQKFLGDYKMVSCTFHELPSSRVANLIKIDFITCDDFFITRIYCNDELKEGPWFTLLKEG